MLLTENLVCCQEQGSEWLFTAVRRRKGLRMYAVRCMRYAVVGRCILSAGRTMIETTAATLIIDVFSIFADALTKACVLFAKNVELAILLSYELLCLRQTVIEELVFRAQSLASRFELIDEIRAKRSYLHGTGMGNDTRTLTTVFQQSFHFTLSHPELNCHSAGCFR